MSNFSRQSGAETPSLLCLASYEKGQRFLEEAKKLSCRVYLLTTSALKDAAWPRESLDDILFMTGDQSEWNLDDMLVVVARLCRHIHLDRVVALDDFDLEKAALQVRKPSIALLIPLKIGDFIECGEDASKLQSLLKKSVGEAVLPAARLITTP